MPGERMLRLRRLRVGEVVYVFNEFPAVVLKTFAAPTWTRLYTYGSDDPTWEGWTWQSRARVRFLHNGKVRSFRRRALFTRRQQ